MKQIPNFDVEKEFEEYFSKHPMNEKYVRHFVNRITNECLSTINAIEKLYQDRESEIRTALKELQEKANKILNTCGCRKKGRK